METVVHYVTCQELKKFQRAALGRFPDWYGSSLWLHPIYLIGLNDG